MANQLKSNQLKQYINTKLNKQFDARSDIKEGKLTKKDLMTPAQISKEAKKAKAAKAKKAKSASSKKAKSASSKKAKS